MMQEKRSYVHGAMLLMVSGLIVKILGAWFKIPLTNLIGDSGMGIFAFAMQFFSILFVITASGIPIAESCLVSEALALGHRKQAQRLVWKTGLVFTLFAAALAAVLALASGWIAERFGEPDAAQSLVAIAPAVVLVTAEAALRGWYQGTGNMKPTSVSQVLEAGGKLLFGCALAQQAIRHGMGLSGAAAGGVLGVTIGELIAVLYLVWSVRRSIGSALHIGSHPKAIPYSRLFSLMIPITLGSAVMTVSGFLDMTLIYGRLPLTGLSAKQITSVYGAYTGMALTMYHLPQAFSGAIAVSMLPAVSAAWSRGQISVCKRLISSACRLTMLVCIPSGAILTVFAKPLLQLLFPSQPQGVSAAAPLLACLGFAELLVGLASVTTSVLQSMERPDITVCTMTIGAAAKFAFCYIGISNSEIGIMAAPLSAIPCFGLILLLNLTAIYCKMKWAPSVVRSALPCIAASCVMVQGGWKLYQWMLTRCSGSIALLAVCAGMPLLYLMVLLLLRGLHYEDVAMLPGGRRLAALLKITG